MRNLFSILLLSSFIFLCGFTKDKLYLPHVSSEVYEVDSEELESLGQRGEKYTRRSGDLDDVSNFSPREGEPYETYRKRMYQTLRSQEEEIRSLDIAIEKRSNSAEDLGDQYAVMQKQEQQMRIALSEFEAGGEFIAKPRPPIKQVPFEQYLVKKGDSLQGIAHERYGTYTGWLALYRFNHKRLPYGPNRLEEGETLLVPNIEFVDMGY